MLHVVHKLRGCLYIPRASMLSEPFIVNEGRVVVAPLEAHCKLNIVDGVRF